MYRHLFPVDGDNWFWDNKTGQLLGSQNDMATIRLNDLIANLPRMKLMLTWKKDNFIILNGANGVEINLPPLTRCFTSQGIASITYVFS